MNMNDVKKLAQFLVKNKYTLEFCDSDIKIINEHMKNSEFDSIINLLKIKEKTAIDVEKDMLLGNVNSLWEFIIDSIHKEYDGKMSRDQFLHLLTPYETTALQFNDFDYNVTCGGLEQWENNAYGGEAEELYDFVADSDYKEKEILLNILDNFIYIRDCVNELNPSDDFYEADVETRFKCLKDYNSDYHKIQDSWKEYFEEYLINNITEDYKQKLYDYNQVINI